MRKHGGSGVINFLQDNLVQPMALGSELKLTPLVGIPGVHRMDVGVRCRRSGPGDTMTLALAEILEASPSTQGLSALMRNDASEAVPSADHAGAGTNA